MRAGPRLLAVGILAAAGVAPATPAAAAACAEGAGVTVVVDFASLGGGTDTDCAAGDPASGLEALRAAGHEPTRAAQQPGYFVCRIDGRPANDPCQRTSPADAYWSYWYAEPGGSWTFSDTGAADRDPAPGTVEGWAFGAGDPPSSPPPRNRNAAAPSPTRAPSPAPVAQRSPVAASPAASAAGSPTASAVPSPRAASASTAATPSPTSSRPTPSASPEASPAPAPGAVAAGRPDDGDSGSLAGPLAALGVVLLLGAAGAYQLQQRRTRDAA